MDSSESEAPQTVKKKRRIPTWVWTAVVTELIHDVIPALFGIVTTLLVLLKAGILQLAHWPVAAFIVLIFAEIILVIAMFAFTLIYVVMAAWHGIDLWFSKISKTEKPKWPLWLRPFDYLAAATMFVITKFIEWRDRGND